jgi:hypothetical protein
MVAFGVQTLIESAILDHPTRGMPHAQGGPTAVAVAVTMAVRGGNRGGNRGGGAVEAATTTVSRGSSGVAVVAAVATFKNRVVGPARR